MSKQLYGLVLAGGKSRRMGHDKALLLRDGQSQLRYIASLLEDVCVKVFVSARSEQQDDPERRQFPTIVDSYDDMGPVAGILSAMDEHPEADWLVVACDLPRLDLATLEYLFKHRDSSKLATAYRSSHDGLPEPLCAIYEPEAFPVLRESFADNCRCPRRFLIDLGDRVCLLDPINPRALDNANTPMEAKSLGLEFYTFDQRP